jgi:C-terminal processing protease CtpA/Prc
MSGATACRALGYKNARHALTVEGARPLTGSTFAAGTLRATDGRVFGIIRIPLFREVEYASVCESVWETFRAGKTAACEESCQAEFRSFAQHAIAQALADDARALQRAGAQAVIVDLTGNGGGTEWAEYAAAALTPKSLRAPDVAFIRGAHWIKAFNDQIADLETRWQTVTDTRVRALLQMERANLVAMRDSASVTCELGELWRDRSFTPLCWNVVKGAASVLPPVRYDFARPYAGPLYIMTDAGTASASEQFAALLQDNGVAHTIGQKTMGVGCGFTNGGNPTTLEHSGLVIWMPDCARLRPDGSNEFEGVTPDHIVDWGEDEVSKTRALLATLENLPRR